MALLLAPALPLAFEVGARSILEDTAFLVWTVTGYGGIVPGVLLLILGIEFAILKNRRARE
jgi:hypothetical protein